MQWKGGLVGEKVWIKSWGVGLKPMVLGWDGRVELLPHLDHLTLCMGWVEGAVLKKG